MTDAAFDSFSNPFREALGRGRPLAGIWSMLNSSNAIEGLAWSGFDWVLIDAEHSPVSLRDCVSHLRAMSAAPALPIVRLAANDPIILKQYLDLGVQTIMLPFIQNADEAHRAVAATRYPPDGVRGYAAMHRASRFGAIRNYVHTAANGIFLIVQIETLEALRNLEKICGVPGVDAVFFGPGDLSASMNKLGRPDDPEVIREIEQAQRIVKKSGKATGVLAPNAKLSDHFFAAGFDFVSVTTDCSLLFNNARATADHFTKSFT